MNFVSFVVNIYSGEIVFDEVKHAFCDRKHSEMAFEWLVLINVSVLFSVFTSKYFASSDFMLCHYLSQVFLFSMIIRLRLSEKLNFSDVLHQWIIFIIFHSW